MKKKLARSLLAFLLVALGSAFPLRSESRGGLIKDAPLFTLWWETGTAKILKSDPVPLRKSGGVTIEAARNEYEPFQIVLHPKKAASGVRVEVSPLRQTSGAEVAVSNISIARVAYVTITRPTDEFGAAGDWPDPLPPLDGPFSAPAGVNSPLWITVFIPKDAAAGDYTGTVSLESEEWSAAVPVRLHVWNFTLPETPSIRSAFGLVPEDIKAYHNLTSREELEKVYDLYMENFRTHRVAPISPFRLYPLDIKISGIPWEGGEFVSDPVHGGRRALKIEDASPSEAVESRTASPVPLRAGVPHRLRWWARTDGEGQEYTVFLQAFDKEGEPLHRLNWVEVVKGSPSWHEEKHDLPAYPPEAASAVLHLFPVFRDATGSFTGTACFDDISLTAGDGGPNLIPGGDFEMDTEGISVETDFRQFDRAAHRYLDGFGFRAFDLPLKGLGTGSFYSHRAGILGGFRQGTPEYDRLLGQHLGQVERHLEENGWLGKEYIYWFDEPDEKDYAFVREGMRNIRKNAPRLTRFITEHKPGPDIMDVSEISCTIFNRVDPAVVARLRPEGREFWSYLCTGPKGPWVTLFIDHPAVNLRIWLWMSYRFGLKGILVWRANYWSSPTVFPDGVLQNPWQDPMSYTVGYGVPYGQVNPWGNGDGRFLYPPNRDPGRDRTKYLTGPVNSIRWEILREGIEDYEYFTLLERAVRAAKARAAAEAEPAGALLSFPGTLFKSGREYTKDPAVLLAYRATIARAIEKLAAAK
jgi:hypothetical protein